MAMTIGKRLKELRTANGLSQDKFGELVGASKSAVSQWENDDTKPNIDNIVALHGKLQFSIDWLLAGTGPAPDADRRARMLLGMYEQLDQRGKDNVYRVAESEQAYMTQDVDLPKRSA